MKKIMLALLILTCLTTLSKERVYAAWQNPTMPFSYEGKTYSDYFCGVGNVYEGGIRTTCYYFNPTAQTYDNVAIGLYGFLKESIIGGNHWALDIHETNGILMYSYNNSDWPDPNQTDKWVILGTYAQSNPYDSFGNLLPGIQSVHSSRYIQKYDGSGFIGNAPPNLIPPFPYNGLTYAQKVVGFDSDDVCPGYERELYTPANSGIWIYHTGPDLHGDFLVTGMFTGNASETISAHEGIIESLLSRDHIRLNETKNCFTTIKSNVDIRWTTNYSQYGDIDNCGYYHEEGDLIVPKNLNVDGTEPINNCIHPSSCAFPNFSSLGANIRDKNGLSDSVYTIDVFNGVPSYLNSKTNNAIYDGSYYQCTEYVARYLYSKFDTDYTDKKELNNLNAQGFSGNDFHPDYEGNPPTPTVDKNNDRNIVGLVPFSSPKIGDVAIFTLSYPATIPYKHSAIVKSVAETKVRLIEQNFVDKKNNSYTTEREVTIPSTGLYFYRYPAAVVDGTNEVSSTIQDAYDSMPTGNQTIKMQTQTFNENLNFSRDVSVTLLGGYDPNFQVTNGMTIIFGSLTISSGTLVAENICIQ